MASSAKRILGLSAKNLAIFLLSALAVGLAVVFRVRLRSPETDFLRGMEAIASGDWEAVRASAEQLHQHAAYHPHESLLRGHLAKQKGNLNQAFYLFSEGINHPETREESWLQGGIICFSRGQYHESIRLLRQVLNWNPESVAAIRTLAACYYDIGAMEQSIAMLQELIVLQPEDHRPHYMRASILKDFERFGEALPAYQAAAERAPTDGTVADEIRSEWADCLIRLRRYADALKVLDAADPWPDVLTRRAQALYSLRRFEEASRAAEDVLSKNPEQTDAILVAAQCCEHSRQTDRGIALVLTALSRQPNELRLHHCIADLYAAAGRVAEAQTHRTRAAELAELRRQFSEAHQATVNDVDNAELRLKLGLIAEQLGETDLARDWYRAALGLAPRNSVIQEHWSGFLNRHPQFAPPVESRSGESDARVEF